MMYLATRSVFLLLVLSFFVTCPSSSATVFTTYDKDLAGFNAAIGGYDAATVTFEGLPAGTLVTNQYAAAGVTFSARPVIDWGHEDTDHSFLRVQEGPGSILDSDPVDSKGVVVPYDESSRSQFTASFAQPVRFLGGYFIDNRSDITVEIVWGSGTTTFISPTGEDGASAAWWGVVADDEVITEAVFTIGLYQDGFGFDNFVFQVPEPGTIFLLGLGIPIIAVVRRRRP